MDEGQQVGLIAFAGKAAVLCPMTTDFGFLRLILNEAEPQSVGLGGTQIGDAIRKAVDGFRESGDIHRLILLVTDGEDHDSFPLEAAKAAKEKGVKIVSVGFGDEAGSKIEVADPQTGGRSFVKDRDGQDVVSRLDGETLRDIALQTDGAYVPAGTGALDLESIYRTHIASMLRGSTEDQQHIVRNEAYQWLVLAALVLLFMGLSWPRRGTCARARWSRRTRRRSRLRRVPPRWWLAFSLVATAARAAGPAAHRRRPRPPQQPAVVPATAAADRDRLPASDAPADGETDRRTRSGSTATRRRRPRPAGRLQSRRGLRAGRSRSRPSDTSTWRAATRAVTANCVTGRSTISAGWKSPAPTHS